MLLKTKENLLFGVHDPIGVNLLSCIILNFSRLNEHNFHHNFWDMINPIYNFNIETTVKPVLMTPVLNDHVVVLP